MKRGQSAAHTLPLRRGKHMDVPSLDDFPEDVQDIVYELIVEGLILYEKQKEAS